MSRLQAFVERSRRLRRKPMGSGLRAIRNALKRVGSPQDSYPSVLIAGTNGKGSTAAMVESIARAGSYRTGFFHSPAWGNGRHHILIDGEPVGEDDLADAFLEVSNSDDLTWFEALTGAAFLLFQRHAIDLAIVEVGLGGNNDCTNVITEPVVSVLVSVALDHEEVLGDDLSAIAAEKCGVFRPGRPAVWGRLPPHIEQVVERQAANTGSKPRSFRDQARVAKSVPGVAGRIRVETGRNRLCFDLPLAGAHQLHNAALAVIVVEALEEELPTRVDRALDSETMTRGLERCQWPGRLEWLDGLPRPVLLDGAHNPDAVDALVSYWVSQNHLPVEVIWGVFRDKNAEAMLRRLRPIVRSIHFTHTAHPRAWPAADLRDLWATIAPGNSKVHTLEFQALPSVALHADQEPLLVTGSLDLVAQARHLLLHTQLKSP